MDPKNPLSTPTARWRRWLLPAGISRLFGWGMIPPGIRTHEYKDNGFQKISSSDDALRYEQREGKQGQRQKITIYGLGNLETTQGEKYQNLEINHSSFGGTHVVMDYRGNETNHNNARDGLVGFSQYSAKKHAQDMADLIWSFSKDGTDFSNIQLIGHSLGSFIMIWALQILDDKLASSPEKQKNFREKISFVSHYSFGDLAGYHPHIPSGALHASMAERDMFPEQTLSEVLEIFSRVLVFSVANDAVIPEAASLRTQFETDATVGQAFHVSSDLGHNGAVGKGVLADTITEAVLISNFFNGTPIDTKGLESNIRTLSGNPSIADYTTYAKDILHDASNNNPDLRKNCYAYLKVSAFNDYITQRSLRAAITAADCKYAPTSNSPSTINRFTKGALTQIGIPTLMLGIALGAIGGNILGAISGALAWVATFGNATEAQRVFAAVRDGVEITVGAVFALPFTLPAVAGAFIVGAITEAGSWMRKQFSKSTRKIDDNKYTLVSGDSESGFSAITTSMLPYQAEGNPHLDRHNAHNNSTSATLIRRFGIIQQTKTSGKFISGNLPSQEKIRPPAMNVGLSADEKDFIERSMPRLACEISEKIGPYTFQLKRA